MSDSSDRYDRHSKDSLLLSDRYRLKYRPMKTTVDRILKWRARVSLPLLTASAAIAQSGSMQAHGNPNLQRHWNPKFDVALPNDVASDGLNGRCWSQMALESYVTNGRFWTEEVYGLPYGYVESHCLKEQLTQIDSSLNRSYKVLLQSLNDDERKQVVASERLWLSQRNRECNVADGVSYVMLGSFVCLMNMTSDRLEWIISRQSATNTTQSNGR